MSNLKQNVWVVTILFLSLLSSVALSYVISPNSQTMTESQKTIKTPVIDDKKNGNKDPMVLLIPKVVK